MASGWTHRAVQRDEEAADWYITLSEGVPSPEELQRFAAWNADVENARAFEAAAHAWSVTGGLAQAEEALQLRERAQAEYAQALAAQPRPRASLGKLALRFLAIAASLLLALVTGLLLFQGRPTIYQTGTGERRVVQLADGSSLSLDASTEIAVRLEDDRRTLELHQGRARFDVAKDPSRPFSVLASGKLVVATGTSFSVERLDRQVRVILFEGQVAVLDPDTAPEESPALSAAAHDQAARARLRPGQELISTIDESAPDRLVATDPDLGRAWEAGLLSLDEEPLATAVERVNRYSRRRIVLGDEAVKRVKVSGVYAAGDASGFLEGLTALHPVQADFQGDRIVLRGK